VGLRRDLRDFFREPGRHGYSPPDQFARLRCRRVVFTRRQADRLLLDARCVPRGQALAGRPRAL
jgi:hypothetical protein